MAEPEEQKLICGYSIQCLYFHRQYHSTCWVRPKRPRLATPLRGGVSHGSHVKPHWAARGKKTMQRLFVFVEFQAKGTNAQTLCRSIFGIALKPQSRQTENLAFYLSRADAAELYFTGMFYPFPLEYGGCTAACAGRGCLTLVLWLSTDGFADVEKW